MSAFVIALLGAESTGKTTLATALGQTLRDSGKNTAVVTE
jgi:molybdopterin-guanine dinucleotide biosynthesis protein